MESLYPTAAFANVTQSAGTGEWVLTVIDGDSSPLRVEALPNFPAHDFYDAGLNVVGVKLDSWGLPYQGAGSWMGLLDGGWEAVVYPRTA